jgi:hypothetical protein
MDSDCASLSHRYCYCACMQVLSVSLFWTGAVLCNTIHVIVSGTLVRVTIHGGCEAASIPSNSIMKSLQYALTTSFGSICYGSLFTAAIRTLRWEVLSTTTFIFCELFEVRFLYVLYHFSCTLIKTFICFR